MILEELCGRNHGKRTFSITPTSTFDLDVDSNENMITVLLPPAIYVIYYFSKKGGQTVEFYFNGTINNPSGTDVNVKISKEVDDAMSEVNELLIKFM